MQLYGLFQIPRCNVLEMTLFIELNSLKMHERFISCVMIYSITKLKDNFEVMPNGEICETSETIQFAVK